MNQLPSNQGIRLFDINWRTQTAGPSPNNNERIEIFLLGCNKAIKGNPCKGCFNSITWDKSKAEWSWNPHELADMVNEGCDPNNKYVTIGGGEPTDQIQMLIPLVKKLKEYGFHIMMYTWRNLLSMLKYDSQGVDFNASYEEIKELIKYLDIVVDGEYKQNERLYQQELGDGMLNSIGSANQIIWDLKAYNEQENRPKIKGKDLYGQYMRDLAGLYIKPYTNDLVYITKE